MVRARELLPQQPVRDEVAEHDLHHAQRPHVGRGGQGVQELKEQIEKLPGGLDDGQLSVSAKAVLELHTQLRVAEPEDMTSERLAELGAGIARLAGLIADAYFV